MTTSCSTPATQQPKFTTYKTTTGITLQVELPGISHGQLSITSEKNRLRIEAQRSATTPESWSLLNDSTRPESYLLELNTHHDLDLHSTVASLRNGILRLEIAKREEVLPRQIPLSDH